MKFADEKSLVVVESAFPARCSCSVEVATSAERVDEACLDWAQDLRWNQVLDAECPLTFRLFGDHHAAKYLGFSVARWREHHGLTLEVRISSENLTSSVQFVGYWDSWESLPIPRAPQVRRAVLAFAHGVCSDLSQRGISVTPPQLGRPAQNRARLKRLTDFRRISEYVLGTLSLLCIPATVAVGILAGRWLMVPFGALCVFLALLFVADYLRRRVVGMKGYWSLLAAALFLLLGVIFVLAGVVPETEWVETSTF